MPTQSACSPPRCGREGERADSRSLRGMSGRKAARSSIATASPISALQDCKCKRSRAPEDILPERGCVHVIALCHSAAMAADVVGQTKGASPGTGRRPLANTRSSVSSMPSTTL